MIDFLLTNLPIVICVFVGLALITVEMFWPGFGLPGILGIVSLLIGAALLFFQSGLLAALEYLVVAIALVAISLSITLKSASSGKLSKSRFILKQPELLSEGQMAESELLVFLGREGEAATPLRPSGIADFDGVRLNVVSDGAYIQPGMRVRIEHVEGNRIVVKEV